MFRLLLYGLIAFVFLAGAAYVGVLRALDVDFSENENSRFLSDDTRR